MKAKLTSPSNLLWEVLDSVEKRRIGSVRASQYDWKMNRLLSRELRASSTRSFESFCRAEDADVRQNTLAVIGEGAMVVYDVSVPVGDKVRLCKSLAEVPLPRLVQYRSLEKTQAFLPCVRWSPEGAILTTSGTTLDNNAVRVLDAATMEVVETVECGTYESKAVFTHEHSRLDPALVGIGTTSSQVLIADLRSGNVTLSSSAKHTNSILGIGWSISDANQLVTASATETFVWDKRYLAKSSVVTLPRPPTRKKALPDMQFLDGRRLLVMTSPDSINLYDAYTGDILRTIEDVHYRGVRLFNRFKFGLNRDTNTVYYAVKRNIRGLNLNTQTLVMDARAGHIYSVGMLLFNDYNKELYSLNGENEAIIWTPFR